MPHYRFYCVICGTAMKASLDATVDVVACPTCARVVPVPRLAPLAGQLADCVPVFPQDVLSLEVKFLCTACNHRLRADARWEGRPVTCPVCTEKTRVPRWSTVARWSRVREESPPPIPAVGASPEAAVVALSREEIEFLSDAAPTQPGTS